MFSRATKIFATSTLVAFAAMAFAACRSSEPQDVSFDLTVQDRALTAETTTFVATQGDTVTLNLSVDEDVRFHLHGYELLQEVEAGATGTITFEADATGLFAIEMHVLASAEDGATENGHDPDPHGEDDDPEHEEDQIDVKLGAIEIRPR